MKSCYELPQIVSARTERAVRPSREASSHLHRTTIVHPRRRRSRTRQAVHQYLALHQFAAANQLFMMANDFGLDYDRIRYAVDTELSAAGRMPGPGLAAGPCLLKDTMQLAAFNNNNFTLGHASMMINEGLPALHGVSPRARIRPVGDDGRDPRDGIQSGVGRHPFEPLLQTEASPALPGRTSPLHRPVRQRRRRTCGRSHEVLAEADLIVIGAPHRRYADIAVDVPVVDVWNLRVGNGERMRRRASRSSSPLQRG